MQLRKSKKMKALNCLTFLEHWADQPFPWELPCTQWESLLKKCCFSRIRAEKQKTWESKLKDTISQTTRSTPPGHHIDVFCEGGKMTSGWRASPCNPVQVPKQHQWPPRAMDLSAVVLLKVSRSKKRSRFLPPRHGSAARFEKKDTLVLIRLRLRAAWDHAVTRLTGNDTFIAAALF